MSGATYKNKPSERPLGGAIYEFLERNHTILTTIENFLRSLSYLIPGKSNSTFPPMAYYLDRTVCRFGVGGGNSLCYT